MADQLYGQVQKLVDGHWIDIPDLCFPAPDWAYIIATEYRKSRGQYRVDVRDHPDGVPQ